MNYEIKLGLDYSSFEDYFNPTLTSGINVKINISDFWVF